MTPAKRREHLRRVLAKAGRRAPGAGISLTNEETHAIVDALPDSAFFDTRLDNLPPSLLHRVVTDDNIN